MKICVGCKKSKPLEDFHKNQASKDGRQAQCKPCNIARVRSWQELNKSKFNAYIASDKYNHMRRANRYGLTVDELSNLLETSSNCPICGTELPPDRKCVDHDHVTGEVRGILCNRCNLRLGWVEQVGLDRISSYLEVLSPQ